MSVRSQTGSLRSVALTRYLPSFACRTSGSRRRYRLMSKTLVPERGGRKRATTPTPQPKLARGTRDISPTTLKVARGTRELSPLFPLDPDEDTIVVDPDQTLAEDLGLEADSSEVGEVGEVGDVAEVTEVTE